MNDLFSDRTAQPMLIGAEGEAFDSPDYLFELKLDGERCLCYLDPKSGSDLRNKKNKRMLPQLPELSAIHEKVACRCVLDGELIVLRGKKPDFSAIQRRTLLNNPDKIALASKKEPACFAAFDILYCREKEVNLLPLAERKRILEEVLPADSEHLFRVLSIEGKGRAFYSLTEREDLEGIVAKRKDSLYTFGKRTKDWIKCKNLKDEDFVICGYTLREKGASLALGLYREEKPIFCGHVALGVDRESLRRILLLPPGACPFGADREKEAAVWVAPSLVCTVQYMTKHPNGSLRQPVFKGLREDKLPEECIVSEEK